MKSMSSTPLDNAIFITRTIRLGCTWYQSKLSASSCQGTKKCPVTAGYQLKCLFSNGQISKNPQCYILGRDYKGRRQ